jgi:hypothetical protein
MVVRARRRGKGLRRRSRPPCSPGSSWRRARAAGADSAAEQPGARSIRDSRTAPVLDKDAAMNSITDGLLSQLQGNPLRQISQ